MHYDQQEVFQQRGLRGERHPTVLLYWATPAGFHHCRKVGSFARMGNESQRYVPGTKFVRNSSAVSNIILTYLSSPLVRLPNTTDMITTIRTCLRGSKYLSWRIVRCGGRSLLDRGGSPTRVVEIRDLGKDGMILLVL